MIIATMISVLSFVLFWMAIARNNIDTLILSFVLGIVAVTLWAVELLEYLNR